MNLKSLFTLLKSAKAKSFEKGEIIITENSTEKNLYYIRKGLTRSYIINEKGDEITFQLYSETDVFTNIHTLLFNEPSKFFYQALELTKVYTIEYDSFIKNTLKNPNLVEINSTFLGKNIMKRAFLRSESFVFLSPEERYKKFVKDHPKLINRVPDMYIAHVLGITPVSLSRIRSRIAKKK